LLLCKKQEKTPDSIFFDFSADHTIAETKGRYDSSTVTIRMDLVKLENENSSLRSEVDSKVSSFNR
jgi:hypothetical protein